MVKDDECKSHCIYKVGVKGDMIVCGRCGRIRAIRNEKGFWENLY
jgi:hypothetical protein